MADLSTADLAALRDLMQGVQNVVETPIAFDRSDPDKNRMREIQGLVGLIVRSELTAGNAARLLQLMEQVKLLFEEIAGVGTRVSMKPAARLIERAVGVLRNAANS